MTSKEILVTPLKEIETPGGNVLHAIKSVESTFKGLGEVYFSWIEFNYIKAWKRHNRMFMNLVVPVGNVKFVFFNESTNEFRVETIGEKNYCRISVPPGIWFGFQGIDSPKSLVVNISDILHEPTESDRLDLKSINYNWESY
ncbi:dTDP-4-dehydrorhamnose 3,5-epimerase [Leptospira bandrabouensis]|uniref:dTDP-4-dehydrorhamnose 3,5-epimerase n=2 Tax=Leptospira TaxID=171 RepID=A0A6H3NSE0_9LEPT|nr:dTDP-4-dehydrorhamnose 3,5-epimerase [Leptospira bandrabouensis]MCW7460344.1 dTDP-4-dehydrorhamnose 3,5-epimerase [Leptospira bandrabouensis]MCW7478177.1 dTDP-4-dehydrorhamnose 3,5-epimerase [Leptospira bandrabouensis]MCW7485701.1 dTDP-4-dehydrorhamnose 3,5-epimerase [Leptospira bandrabouensis]TGN03752.1 dTDP-4-dehydrorhamnose 3,5-epimerase [Leptospira bandrabouensis]TGN12223.1 dTDP-4-dehydrorhamnose 3,5-epimerase [Leptospira bandrabouensis]